MRTIEAAERRTRSRVERVQRSAILPGSKRPDCRSGRPRQGGADVSGELAPGIEDVFASALRPLVDSDEG
jgi:hypothetical protein